MKYQLQFENILNVAIQCEQFFCWRFYSNFEFTLDPWNFEDEKQNLYRCFNICTFKVLISNGRLRAGSKSMVTFSLLLRISKLSTISDGSENGKSAF